ncbi:MAG: tetratricopeptide repeat protein [Bacteroidia bacterium]|nr:tetratricopeptide repeat protein [Bacteroidia bacterium]
MSKNKTNKSKQKEVPQALSSKSFEKFWFWGMLAIVVLVYLPSLFNGFTNWDDPAYITKNEFIKGLGFENLKAMFGEFHNGHYHPLTWLSLAINYSFSELNSFGYHLTNMIIHLFNVVLVFLFIKKLSQHWQVAILTALLFGIHPLSVESVAWVTERKNVLYTFFFLFSLIVYIKYIEKEKIKLYLVSLILFLISVLSKSPAIILPFVLLLIDYLKERKLISKKVIFEKIPFFIFTIVFGIITSMAQAKVTIVSNEIIPTDVKLIYGAWGFLKYFFLIIIPYGLSAFYPYIISDYPAYYFIGWIFISIYIWVIWHNWKKNNRIVVFGLLFFFVNIFLFLKFFNLIASSYYIADRYTYVASIGLFFIFSNYLIKFKPSDIGYSSLSKFIILIIIVIFGITTFNRNKIWKNSLTLWDNVIEKYPGAVVPLLNQGNAFRDEARYSDALNNYNKVIKTDSTFFEAISNRGYVQFMLGNYNAALIDFNRALLLMPTDKNLINNKALCYQKLGNSDIVEKEIKNSISKGDANAESYNLLGNTYFEKNKFKEAEEQYSKAIELDTKTALYWYNRANSRARLNMQNEACSDYNKAIEIDNTNSDYYFNRGTTKYFLKDFTGAKNDMLAAIKLNPNNASYYLNKSNIEIALGNIVTAIDDISNAIKLDVNNSQNYLRRAILYFQTNKKDLGCKDANTALRLGNQAAVELMKKNCK